MELSEIRGELDRIDDEIAKLLDRRFQLVNEVGRTKIDTKSNIRDDKREKTILERVVKDRDNAREISDVFKRIFELSRNRQTVLAAKHARGKGKKFIKVINGVNLNMLGIREPELYGRNNYEELVRYIYDEAERLNCSVITVQSNSESVIVDEIQNCLGIFDGIIINPGAYTHTSVAILDALKAVNIPVVEVHLTDVDDREAFRKISYVSEIAEARYKGLGIEGYSRALEFLVNN